MSEEKKNKNLFRILCISALIIGVIYYYFFLKQKQDIDSLVLYIFGIIVFIITIIRGKRVVPEYKFPIEENKAVRMIINIIMGFIIAFILLLFISLIMISFSGSL